MAKQLSFGEFLHKIRVRQNGTKLARDSGISYVYLLDIEKGARPVPRKTVLCALANHLDFADGERKLFFDLAAKEKEEVPTDVTEYIKEHPQLIDIIRVIMTTHTDERILYLLQKNIEDSINEEIKVDE